MLLPLVFDWLEWTARRNEGSPIGPLVDILWLGLVEAGWVAQRENDGSFDVFRHFADDLFREGFGFGGCSNEDMRFDVLHD